MPGIQRFVIDPLTVNALYEPSVAFWPLMDNEVVFAGDSMTYSIENVVQFCVKAVLIKFLPPKSKNIH